MFSLWRPVFIKLQILSEFSHQEYIKRVTRKCTEKFASQKIRWDDEDFNFIVGMEDFYDFIENLLEKIKMLEAEAANRFRLFAICTY